MTDLQRKTLIDKLISIAQLEVGVTEDIKNNTGLRIVEYQKATWLAPAAWAWCAAFMCYITKGWLNNNVVQQELGIKDVDNWRCKDASAFGWITWGKKKGFYITDEKELAKAGDIVVYDFSHVGLVIKDQLSFKEKIVTIEGNVEPNSTQRDGSKDGVYEMKRSCKLVKAYIRIFK